MASLLALTAVAASQAAVPVLVTAFEGADLEAEALAERMPQILADELSIEGIQLLDVWDNPPVGDTLAPMYLDACPHGQLEGCSFVLGEGAKAAYVILGRVRTLDPPEPPPLPEDAAEPVEPPEPPPVEREVTLRILDIGAYEEVLSVVLVHTRDSEDSFADAVPLMIQDAAEGWVGDKVDIRTTVTKDEDGVDKDAAAQDLDALSQELGEVDGHGESLDTSEPRYEERPRKSLAQLLEENPGRPAPWDDWGITPRQYTAWWNSGWDFYSWSRRLRGRKGQLLLRAHGGWGLGPTHTLYYGRAAYYGDGLLDEEFYTTHEVATGLGSHLGLSLGYGILPTVEIEAGASREGGKYNIDARMVYNPGEVDVPREVSEEPAGTPQVWVGARWVPMPQLNLRPVAGLGVAWWFGNALEEEQVPISDLATFYPALITSVRGLVGAELRLHDKLDLFLQLPLHLLVAGTSPAVLDEQILTGAEYGLDDKREPGKPVPIAASLQLGAQLRLGGGKARRPSRRPSHEDELDEL